MYLTIALALLTGFFGGISLCAFLAYMRAGRNDREAALPPPLPPVVPRRHGPRKPRTSGTELTTSNGETLL